MQIPKIGSTQAFGRKNDKSERIDIMNNFSTFFDSTSKDFGTVADVLIATKNAVDTPEETTIRVMSEKLDDVVNSEKSPSWIKKPLTYVVAATITGLTWFASAKALKAPGKVLNYSKKYLSKSKVGTSILNFADTIKEKSSAVVNAFKIKDKTIPQSISDFFKNRKKSISKYFKKNFPETRKNFNNLLKKLKMNKWTTKDYVRNTLAAITGVSSGKRYINKHSESAKIMPKETDNIDDSEVRAAA